MRLVDGNQFDTIYHEHFCYFSLIERGAIFAGHGMTIFDVEELWTHGGSLRIYARHAADDGSPGHASASLALRAPRGGGGLPRDRDVHARSRSRCARPSASCSSCSSRSSEPASASSATALPARATRCSTTAASGTDFIDFTVDRNPYKQGRFPAGHAHPDLRAREDRRDASRTTS